jgi:integrase/recombinase XerC
MDSAPGTSVTTVRGVVAADFAMHLRAQRGLSEHTVRAYVGDIEHLMAFAGRYGRTEIADIDLGLLRAWLASMAAAERSRATGRIAPVA